MNYFVRKLRHGSNLTKDNEEALTTLSQGTRRVNARGDIVVEGSAARSLPLILNGWACRYRQLENGKRQIISFFLPGDLCEPFGILPRFMDYSLGAITPVTLTQVSPEQVETLAQVNPTIKEALWWDLLVAMAIEREHVVSIGRRSAAERLGHLFCELHLRLEIVGLADGLKYEMPATQADLADMLGLSAVHVNRSLMDLRGSGLISLRGRHVTIHDLGGLRAASLFDPAYLHLRGAASTELSKGRDAETT